MPTEGGSRGQTAKPRRGTTTASFRAARSLSKGSSGSHGLGFASVFLLVLLLAASVPAGATIYNYAYGNDTGTVRSLSVSLAAGTAGSSSISPVAADAASAAVTAGLTFYEDAGAPTAPTPITVDTGTATPGTGNLYTVNKGSTAYLWSPQYTVSSTLYAGNWLLDLWASAAGKAGTMSVTITTVDSTGATVSTIVNSQPTVSIAKGTTAAEYKTTFGGAAGSVPANGYVLVALGAPSGGANPTSFTVYWGTGQLTNFQSPNTYNYVLGVSNGATSAWTVSLGTASGMTSTLGRLTNVTIWFVSPFSKQVVVTSGSLSQNSGLGATLAGSGSISIAVAAYSNAMPTSVNVPSTMTVSLKLLSATITTYSQYTISLTID